MKRIAFNGMAGLIGGLTLALVAGCVDISQKRGVEVTSESLEKIEKGVTTSSELVRWFGAPTTKMEPGDGRERWVYSSMIMSTRSGGPLAVFGISRSETSNRMRNVTFEILNGVVENWSVLESDM